MVRCALCPAEVADFEEAEAEGWSPEIYLDATGDEGTDPVCPACFDRHVTRGPDGCHHLKPEALDAYLALSGTRED